MPQFLYEFGPFQVDPSEDGRLLRDGNVVPLAPKPFKLLLFLLEHNDRYYKGHQLLTELYDDAVENCNIPLLVSAIRKALGDKKTNGYEYIQNVGGKGYIFAKQVRKIPIPDAGAPSPLRQFLESTIEEKSQDFVGRESVFAELERFLKGNDRGYFIIIGEPGIGKTSLLAHLIKARRLAHTTYVYHFNDELSGVVHPGEFLQNVCEQLIERYHPGRLFDPKSIILPNIKTTG